MNLDLNGSEVAENASETDLTTCLDSFFGGAKDSIVILSSGEKFVQVCKGKNEEFILERQDGSAEQHFRCSNQNLSREQVRSAFKGFHTNRPAWVEELSWEREILDDDSYSDSDLQSNTPLTLRHMMILLAIVAIALAYSLIKTFA
jgi:hypothetical protein